METVNNLATAASRAIWGENNTTSQSGTEPIAGEQGKGTINDAYDHGNEEQGNTVNTNTSTDPIGGSTSTTHRDETNQAPLGSGADTSITSSGPTTGSALPSRPKEETNESTESGLDKSSSSTGPSTGSSTGPTTSSTTTTRQDETNIPPVPTGAADTSGSARDGPSNAVSGGETGDPKSGQAPEARHQGAGKPHEEPSSSSVADKMPHSDEEREKMMETGNFPHDPNDHSGEPLKMHNEKSKVDDKDGEEEVTEGKKERSESVAHEGGAPHGSSKGTGQEVVKASGVAAEGGDFDASKPGAGSEATRLLEEKGIHKTVGNQGPPEVGADTSTDSGAKVSKMEKIKEKLHLKH